MSSTNALKDNNSKTKFSSYFWQILVVTKISQQKDICWCPFWVISQNFRPSGNSGPKNKWCNCLTNSLGVDFQEPIYFIILYKNPYKKGHFLVFLIKAPAWYNFCNLMRKYMTGLLYQIHQIYVYFLSSTMNFS